VWTERTIETPVALLGNAANGVVSVPLSASLGERELSHILADADPKLVVATSEASEGRTPGRRVARMVIDVEGGASLPLLRVGDDPLLILYTSGTTGHGRPRAPALSCPRPGPRALR
jgi:malonyl-CoA/methylmalonyl-CoA synthetase